MLGLVLSGAALPLHCWAQDASQQPPSPLSPAAELRLKRLQDQADRNPGNKPYLYDYIQALEEAGRDAELLALLPRVDQASAPASVLARLGRAANNLKRFALAAEIFQAALKKAPDRADILAGLAYALVDSGRPADAVALLEARASIVDKQVPLLEAYAEALKAQREHVQALQAYDRILALDPGNRDAQRNRIRTVAQLGALHRAFELAQQHPGLLDEAELAALAGGRAAVATRWGAAADPDGPGRFANTDVALACNETLLQSALAGSGAQRRLQFDRIVLLRNRFRMQEAVDLHQALIDENVEVPPYVQVAVAEAWLYLEQPEKARELYLQAQSSGSLDVSARTGLFYAYLDAEQHEQAITQIDLVVEETPRKVRAYSPLTVGDNPDYASAVTTAAAARGYQDRLDDAQRRLEEYRDLAPWHMEGREKLANLYAARGWPRRAGQEYQWVLAAEPRYRAARTGQAGNLRVLRDWRAAELEALALEAEYPEDRQVQRVARLWDIHQMRELNVEAGTGKSSGSGGPLGSREHQVETHLYSAPYKYDWRAFLHQFEAQATFPAGKGYRRRLGAGVEYRVRDWRASAELSDSYDDDSDIGLSVAGDWWMDDHWNFEAAAETSTNDIPLQARLADVNGKSLRFGAGYRVSESRRFNAGYQNVDFSDGNRRDVFSGSAFQRLVTGPVYKLDALLSLYTSQNSRASAPYFNPESDFSAGVTLIGEQRIWRRYDRGFVHRLYASLGSYEQKNFGSGSTGGLRYEHEWSLDDRLGILYGAQRGYHPYDGQREYLTYYNLAVNWKF